MAVLDLVNLASLIDDAKCFALVRQHRWSEGVRCPGCGSVTVVRHGSDDTQPHRQRYRAPAPNALWQADHTPLDILVLDEGGKPVRTWLTTVLDDHSRAVAGYMVFLGTPCVLNTCLALRHAIWRKTDPA